MKIMKYMVSLIKALTLQTLSFNLNMKHDSHFILEILIRGLKIRKQSDLMMCGGPI